MTIVSSATLLGVRQPRSRRPSKNDSDLQTRSPLQFQPSREYLGEVETLPFQLVE